MLHLAIVTLALISGECPSCQAIPGTLPRIRVVDHFGPLGKAIPPYLVGCAGQDCFSCNRALIPGVPNFNYRTDFNYPWSQAPCWLPPPRAAYGPIEEDLVPPVPEEVPLPESEARRKAKTPSVARRTNQPLRAKSAGHLLR